MCNYYSIGDMIVSIEGNENSNYFLEFTKYFEDKKIDNHDDAERALIIEIRDLSDDNLFFNPKLFSLSGSIAFNEHWFRIRKGIFSYAVGNLFDEHKPTELVLFPRNKKFDGIKRIGSSLLGSTVGDHNKYERFVSRIANYSCLWYIFALSFMKKRSVFAHCGMMAKDGSGILLTGTGGCGKTSTMIELITNSGYSFMAEDFGILREDGMLFDMQKKAAIYQSDVKWGNKYLTGAISKLSGFERIGWAYKDAFGLNPHHYFLPSEIFGTKIAHKAELKEAYILQRTPKGTQLRCSEISNNELADRMKTASFREIKELYEVLSNIRAVGGDEYYKYYPDVFELERRYLDIAGKALDKVACYELAVPLNVDPKETASELLARRKIK